MKWHPGDLNTEAWVEIFRQLTPQKLVGGSPANTNPVSLFEVTKVLGAYADHIAIWMALVKLNDSRYAFIHAERSVPGKHFYNILCAVSFSSNELILAMDPEFRTLMELSLPNNPKMPAPVKCKAEPSNLRTLIYKKIDYWYRQQPGHASFEGDRDYLTDTELVEKFSIFMIRQGHQR